MIDTLKTYGPTSAVALVAGVVGALVVHGATPSPKPAAPSRSVSPAVAPQQAEAPKPGVCAAAAGTFDSLDAVPQIDGCHRIMAERPMSLVECGADRTHVLVREYPGGLLVIRCELAKDIP